MGSPVGRTDAIPVIDLFAGPGGLGEGFSSLRADDDNPVFRIALSVEMDEAAHRTLELRAFYRQFTDEDRPEDYYAYIRRSLQSAAARDSLFATHPDEAAAAKIEAWQHRLSPEAAGEATIRARGALKGADEWVLVGGPPCQAYSVVGRSRRANDEGFAADEKHTLYRHYLRIIEDLQPPVFVMENVKGLLSARLGHTSTFRRVIEDLQSAGPGYQVVPFVGEPEEKSRVRPADFVIRAEDFGVPQTRHRVILLGLRSDVHQQSRSLTPASDRVATRSVLADLPRLRSHLSGRNGTTRDSANAWLHWLSRAAGDLASSQPDVAEVAAAAVAEAAQGLHGGDLNGASPEGLAPAALRAWYGRDARVNGQPLNHASRRHIPEDLARYQFCASYAHVHGRSPMLRDFPHSLLPAHANVHERKFTDRFRVQIRELPATTVTSHISKDGHYYIHYDPSQCRSLSVREAARLQTFPDDYFFEGNHTQQYHQVGNAVPPFLANQLARVVAQTMGWGCAKEGVSRTDGQERT